MKNKLQKGKKLREVMYVRFLSLEKQKPVCIKYLKDSYTSFRKCETEIYVRNLAYVILGPGKHEVYRVGHSRLEIQAAAGFCTLASEGN